VILDIKKTFGEEMLQFLRKHQRYFFIVITAAIVVSFSFFGTYSSMNRSEAPKDKEIGRGVSGKPVMQQELAALCRLIGSSPYDHADRSQGAMPNFLNDGVMERDFFSSGLGVMLAKRYFDELKGDLDPRVKKIQQFHPYVHPHSYQISAEGAWARYSPEMLERFRLLKTKSDQPTTETLALMFRLYIDQAMVPPDALKYILRMQQQQMGVEPDPLLGNSDLRLFGFTSIEDWFGPRFVSLIGQFIVNAAQAAEERGYEIAAEEVRADLFQNIYQGYRQLSQNAELTSEEAHRYYQMKMRALGFDEAMLIGTWKKVMLFRRLFEDGSGSVLMDPLAYQQFDRFAKENVRIALYQLPAVLQFADFRSMLKFQLYLEGVALDAGRLRTDLRLPRQMATEEQIGKKIPELVQRDVELEWSAVSKEELTRSISIKESWEWEVADAHWEQLKKTFPELASCKADTKMDRLVFLNSVDAKLRAKIDQCARENMVGERPAEIRLALENAPTKRAALGLKMRGTEFPFLGVKDNVGLGLLVEGASLKGEAPNAAAESLAFYSPDDEHFYSIQVVAREDAKRVLRFAEASKDGTLDKLLDKKLEEAYPEVRKKDTRYFQQSNGSWKPFKEVRDQIGKYLFSDLTKTIEDRYRTHFGVLPGREGDLPTHFYSSARLIDFMRDAQEALKVDATDSHWLRGEGQEESLAAQWLIEVSDQLVERCTQVNFSKEEMFLLPPRQWSDLKIGDRGALAFYIVQEKGSSLKPSISSVEQGHQILAHDAKCDMMLQMLHRIERKKAIDLTSAFFEERE
jgi:GcvH upstream region-like protein